MDLSKLEPPTTRIREDEDVDAWKTTKGFRDYALFIRRLNDAVIGRTVAGPLAPSSSESPAAKLVAVLHEIARWTDDIPPRPTPQRFGNLAFRDWGHRLEERADELVASILPNNLRTAVPLLTPYFVASFGSFGRIDYGTGHELSFALFLLCLSLLDVFHPTPESDRELVLVVFQEYMNTVWRLQDVYRLEPAGSHGVWGLDDFSFLGYLWGSAQLSKTDSQPADVLRSTTLPETNLYFACINRIHKYKKGPFHEHSSQLHAIASQVPHWGKVNSGMFKMYDAEVLGKRVVVQHIPLGGLISWDPVPVSARAPVALPRQTDAGAATNILPPMRMQAMGRGTSSQKTTMPPPPPPLGRTGAPWARSTSFPSTLPPVTVVGAAATGAPWATLSPNPPLQSPRSGSDTSTKHS